MNIKKINDKIIYIFFIVYYLISFYIVVRSGYLYDDRLNYIAKGWTYNNDKSLLYLTISIVKDWLRNTGRLFIFSSYTYILLGNLTLLQYKILIILTIFLNGVMVSKLIKELTLSDSLKYLTMLLFPVFISLNSSYFNAIFGFHMLLQIMFLEILIAIYMFIIYIKTQQKRYQILNCIFLIMSLLTYEVSFVLFLLYFVVAICFYKEYFKTINKMIKSLLPPTIIWFIILIANFILRMNAVSGYAGTKFSFNFFKILTGFLKQCTGSFSLFVCLREINQFNTFKELIYVIYNSFNISTLIIIILFLIGYYLIINRYKKEKIKNKAILFIFGLTIFIFPSALIALSERYQSEIDWGFGYLPAYISCWGITIVIALLIRLMKKVTNKVYYFSISIIFISIIIINQTFGNILIDNSNNTYQYPVNLIKDAINMGILENSNEYKNIVGVSNYFFDQMDSSHFYATFLKEKITVMNRTEFYTLTENEKLEEDLYILCTKYFDKEKGYFVIGKCEDYILQNIDNTVEEYYYIKDIKIYIKGDYNYLSFEDKDGNFLYYNLDDQNLVSTKGNERIYQFELENLINVYSIDLVIK